MTAVTFSVSSLVHHSAQATFTSLAQTNEYSTISLDSNDIKENLVVTEYVVQPGDTVTEIAEKHGLSTDTLLWANDITATSPIKPGQELKILPFNGLVYTAKDGDTISKIADRFDAQEIDIIEVNKLSNGKTVKPGQDIIVPRSFERGSYLLARGGSDEVEADEDDVSKDEDAEEAPVVAEDEPEPEAAEVVSRSGWTCPAPGAVLTQGPHGSSGGVDFGAPVGTSVIAADGGTVTKAATGYNGGYGNVVEIDHHDGTTSLYAHLSSVLVSKGESVSAGQALGYIGLTGKTTGPHLHFEVEGDSNPFAGKGYLSRCN